MEERKMRVLDAEFVKNFIRTANDGWEQGWHERNGGNLSYRIRLVYAILFDWSVRNR